MGYYVTIQDSSAYLPIDNYSEAYLDIIQSKEFQANDSETFYSSSYSKSTNGDTNFVQLMIYLGFDNTHTENGFRFQADGFSMKYYDTLEVYLRLIAKYITLNPDAKLYTKQLAPYIEFVGEDYEKFKYDFVDGNLYVYEGSTIWWPKGEPEVIKLNNGETE